MPWLATFADMVTLLLAFFILMYTVSKVDQHKYEQIVRSFNIALTSSPEMSVIQQTYFMPENPTPIEMDPEATPAESMIELYETLKQTFEEELATNRMEMNFDPTEDVIQVVFPELIAFDLGSADLQPRFLPMLRKFSIYLRGDVNVKVIGHSDRLPIVGGRFRSNWELSSARGSAVIEQFIRDGVIRPEQATAIGLADTRPISMGSSVEDYALNRRVEILIERNKSTKPNPSTTLK
jgi:chemotaxis protein MotB